MGVIDCSRQCCRNIMCDRTSPQYGNICWECFDELVATGPTTDIAEFMRADPKNDTKAEAEARYSAVFEERGY